MPTVAEDEENMETKARLALLSSALDLSKDIINTEQKGWFGKFIKTKKDNKKTLGVRISEMEKDIHKVCFRFSPSYRHRPLICSHLSL